MKKIVVVLTFLLVGSFFTSTLPTLNLTAQEVETSVVVQIDGVEYTVTGVEFGNPFAKASASFKYWMDCYCQSYMSGSIQTGTWKGQTFSAYLQYTKENRGFYSGYRYY